MLIYPQRSSQRQTGTDREVLLSDQERGSDQSRSQTSACAVMCETEAWGMILKACVSCVDAPGPKKAVKEGRRNKHRRGTQAGIKGASTAALSSSVPAPSPGLLAKNTNRERWLSSLHLGDTHPRGAHVITGGCLKLL